MNLGDLYPAILTLVLVGMILGVGLIVLDKFSQTSGIGTTAATAINTTIEGIDDFPTWIATIVVIIAAAVVIGLVIRSFRG